MRGPFVGRQLTSRRGEEEKKEKKKIIGHKQIIYTNVFFPLFANFHPFFRPWAGLAGLAGAFLSPVRDYVWPDDLFDPWIPIRLEPFEFFSEGCLLTAGICTESWCCAVLCCRSCSGRFVY